MEIYFLKSDRNTLCIAWGWTLECKKIGQIPLKIMRWVIFLHLDFAKNDPEPW